MNKNKRKTIKIILVVALIVSFAWGTLVRGLGNWGTRTYPTWWSNDIFWANICQIVIPIGIILLLIYVNKKK